MPPTKPERSSASTLDCERSRCPVTNGFARMANPLRSVKERRGFVSSTRHNALGAYRSVVVARAPSDLAPSDMARPEDAPLDLGPLNLGLSECFDDVTIRLRC